MFYPVKNGWLAVCYFYFIFAYIFSLLVNFKYRNKISNIHSGRVYFIFYHIYFTIIFNF